MSKNILITGARFIGKHFVDYVLENTNWNIIVMYRENRGEDKNRITYWKQDLTALLSEWKSKTNELPKIDFIVHMAAETYVDDSLKDCIPFVKSNVLGTANLLEWIKRYYPATPTCVFSSDEVMGPAPQGIDFKENDQRKPSNPYAATKGAAELLAYSFAHSFNLPIFVVRCMNVYGRGQAPQKFIPKTIEALRQGKKIILHGTDKNNVASRHWVHAKDCADAVMYLLYRGKPKEIYHITGEERSVYYIAQKLYAIMSEIKELDLRKWEDVDKLIEYVDFHKARPGHDRRYSLDGSKLKAMGWKPKFMLEDYLKDLI